MSEPDDRPPWDCLIDQRRREREERRVIAALLDATRRGDRATLVDLIGQIDYVCFGWKRVFQRLARLDRVSRDMQWMWLQFYIQWGEHTRVEVGDDLLLIRALRVLLPPYRGPAVTLFRGEGARNRHRRTYGLSWTSEREVAEDFANRDWRTSVGGSVLLQTRAPPAAIICAPHRLDNRFGEREYLVDRRRLDGVTVLKRFSQLSHEEYRRQT